MKEQEMNLAILGFGGMGYWHAHNAVKVSGVNLIGSYDVNPNAYYDSLEIPVYASEEALFADPRVNTVLLTVPNHLHKEYAIKAARAGKNVLCEKPAALTVTDFDEMTAEAQKCGVLFTVHQNRRWDRDFNIVRRLYNEGTLGTVFNIESTLHSPNGKVHNWHQFPQFGGGMIYDWGVHLVDQILTLIPKPLHSVYTDAKSVHNPLVEDFFRIILKFEDGESACLSQSTFVLKPAPRWLICGDKGTAIIEDFACTGNVYTTSELVTKLPPRIEENPAGPTRSFLRVPPGKILISDLPQVQTDWTDFYKNYIDVINGRAAFIVQPPQVRRVLAVLEACFASARAGASVPFPYDKENPIVVSHI